MFNLGPISAALRIRKDAHGPSTNRHHHGRDTVVRRGHESTSKRTFDLIRLFDGLANYNGRAASHE